MKNILILVGGYKPYTTPNGNIAHNVAVELKSNGYNVSVITRKNVVGLKEKEKIDGITVYRIRDLNLMVHNYCIKKIKVIR